MDNETAQKNTSHSGFALPAAIHRWQKSSRNGAYKWLSFNISVTKTKTIVLINIPDTQRPLLLDIYVRGIVEEKKHQFDIYFLLNLQFKHLGATASYTLSTRRPDS